MKKAKQITAAALALMLGGCGAAPSGRVIDNELILKDNSGIISQLKITSRPQKQSDKPQMQEKLNYPEQRGIWLSYIDLGELFYGCSREELESGFETVCRNCKAIGVNTLYIHCRAFGDAFYPSRLFQKTKTFGDIDFDPFGIMVDIAHKNNLSVHAWINPLRCETAEQLENADSTLAITKWYKSGDDRLSFCDESGHYWLDPSYKEVRQLICDGVAEIIDSYDVDGVHFDDYFYPTTDESFDKVNFKRSNSDDLKAWRTENINKLVCSVYKTVKSKNKAILFGISPQGNIGNNYEYMYADVSKWCSETGYVDYILPQIYFGFENSVLPFERCADEWSALVKSKSVSLIIGLAAYKIYSEDEFIEKADILSLQINSAKKLKNFGGYAFYNYISLFPSDSEKAVTAEKHLKGIKKTGGG